MKQERKLEYVEGEQASENFTRMTKHLLSITKNVIEERQKARKSKK